MVLLSNLGFIFFNKINMNEYKFQDIISLKVMLNIFPTSFLIPRNCYLWQKSLVLDFPHGIKMVFS